MKKLLFLAALCTLVGVFDRVSAQDAAAVIERYNKIMDAGQAYVAKTNIMAKKSISTMMSRIPCKVILSNPTHRMRSEVKIHGYKMLVIIDGEQGWMSSGPGMQPLSAEQIEDFRKKVVTDLFSGMRWDTEGYDFELLEPRTENGKKYDVVKAIAQKEDAKKKDQTLYFDNATGLLAFIDPALTDGNLPIMRTVYGNYKTVGECVYPSEVKIMVNGMTFGGVTTTLVSDYPLKDKMFAEPKQVNQ